jgi:hypothetical protein
VTLFSSQTFARTNTPTFSNLVILHTYPPMKMEKETECSETSAYKIQTLRNYPEESVQQTEYVSHLKSISPISQCVSQKYGYAQSVSVNLPKMKHISEALIVKM